MTVLARAVLAVRAAGWTVVAPVLGRLPPRRLVRLLDLGPRAAATPYEGTALRVVTAMRWPTAARRPDGDCLVRSVALYRTLGGRLDLVFGAGIVDDVLRGHAWLERDGQPLFERVDPSTWCREMFRLHGLPR